MQRITITLEDEFARMLDGFVAARGFASRSEAFRDLLRAGLAGLAEEGAADGHAVATLSYVFDFDVRELAHRLVDLQHRNHHLVASSMQMPLDHHARLEVLLMRGDCTAIREFAATVLAERGVRHGRLNLVPVATEAAAHSHGAGKVHSHLHLKVKDAF